MTKHTAEPWAHNACRNPWHPDNALACAVWTADGERFICTTQHAPGKYADASPEVQDANARRIAACVNAMPKVELLLRLIGTDNPQGLQDMRDLRDEIRAVLSGDPSCSRS